jgi:hypothetical protein
MSPNNIEEMVRVIAGAFPNADIFKPDVIKAWGRNPTITGMTPEQARKVTEHICAKSLNFPLMNEVVGTYHRLFGSQKLQCRSCHSSGWVQADYELESEHKWLVKVGGELKEQTIKYTGVVRCPDCN